MLTRPFEGLLFDLDGVLVLSRHVIVRQVKAWANSHSLDPEYVLGLTWGRRDEEVVREALPDADLAREMESIQAEEVHDTRGIAAMAGAAELLASLSAGDWSVVTSARRAVAEARLFAAGLPVPERMVTAEEVRLGKPNPEPYVVGARRLGKPADRCIAFEDARAGIDAAHGGGMFVVGVAAESGYAATREADVVVDDLRSIACTRDADGCLALVIHERAR